MDTIMDIAQAYNLLVIEDAAQGIFSSYKGRPLGSIGDIGCLSFHETKNIISGEVDDSSSSRPTNFHRWKGCCNRIAFYYY